MLTDLLESIRRILGVSETEVPDEMIRDPLIGGAVEQRVRDMIGDPPYESRPPEQQVRIERAVALLTAASLLGTRELREMSATETERFSDQYQVSRSSADLGIVGWQSDLHGQAMDALAPLLKRTITPAIFTTAAGRRGA